MEIHLDNVDFPDDPDCPDLLPSWDFTDEDHDSYWYQQEHKFHHWDDYWEEVQARQENVAKAV